MADEMLSLQGRQQADQVTAQAIRRRLAITLVAALVLIGAGWITLWAAGGSPAPAPAALTASRRPSDEVLETTKSLQVTQQQAVDQLQVVQDQLVAQRAETKRLADQFVALTQRTRRPAAIDRQHAADDPRDRVALRSAAKSTLRPKGCPAMTQGSPLVSPGYAGCRGPAGL